MTRSALKTKKRDTKVKVNVKVKGRGQSHTQSQSQSLQLNYEREEGEIIDDDDSDDNNNTDSDNNILDDTLVYNHNHDNDNESEEYTLRYRIRQLEDYNRKLQQAETVTISSPSETDSVIFIDRRRRRRNINSRTLPSPRIRERQKRLRPSEHQNLPSRKRVRRRSITPDTVEENYTNHTKLRLRNAIRVSSVAPDKSSLRNRLNAMLGKNTSKLRFEKKNLKEDYDSAKPLQQESDDDLEILRQTALNSKIPRPPKKLNTETHSPEKNEPVSDDEINADELRIIALRSAVQKKAKKGFPKKRKKEMTRSCNLYSEAMIDQEIEELFQNEIEDSDINRKITSPHNNNDSKNIGCGESPTNVDSEFSGTVDNYKDNFSIIDDHVYLESFNRLEPAKHSDGESEKEVVNIQEDPHSEEEDENALREQLLSSIKNNLKPISQSVPVIEPDKISSFSYATRPNIIIRLGESDSESDCEEVKNLTKMHRKLTDPVEFQSNLDAFLKTIRTNVEKTNSASKINSPLQAVKRLPRSEQIEYLKLIKRMKELEKKKIVDPQSTKKSEILNNRNMIKDADSKPPSIVAKEKKLPASSNFGTALNQQMISLSEKIKSQNKLVQQLQTRQNSLNETNESLKAKFRAIRLELQRSRSAFINNSRVLETAKGKLIKMRKQFKTLDNRLTSLKSTKSSNSSAIGASKKTYTVKENIQPSLASKKVSVIKKTTEVKVKEAILKNCKTDTIVCECSVIVTRIIEEKIKDKNLVATQLEISDYVSPLCSSNQDYSDPQAIFCPYLVGGSCKDQDCKYFHPKT